MKIAEIMTPKVRLASPEQTVEEAAKAMAEADAGALPVGENDRLIGVVTDRDIVVRGVANGKGGKTKIRDVMTKEVKYCFDDEDVEDVAENMAEHRLRRMLVLNREKRLVGLVSIGDIALSAEAEVIGDALRSCLLDCRVYGVAHSLDRGICNAVTKHRHSLI